MRKELLAFGLSALPLFTGRSVSAQEIELQREQDSKSRIELLYQ